LQQAQLRNVQETAYAWLPLTQRHDKQITMSSDTWCGVVEADARERLVQVAVGLEDSELAAPTWIAKIRAQPPHPFPEFEPAAVTHVLFRSVGQTRRHQL
jgi:hypothetical protein